MVVQLGLLVFKKRLLKHALAKMESSLSIKYRDLLGLIHGPSLGNPEEVITEILAAAEERDPKLHTALIDILGAGPTDFATTIEAIVKTREVNFFSRPANPLSIWSSSLPKPEISAEHHCQACSKQAGCQMIRPAAQM